MNKVLLLVISCLMFAACKKSGTIKSEEPITEKKYPVSFNISGFTESKAPFSTNNTTSKTTAATGSVSEVAISKILYVVFDTTGKQVSRMEQFKGGQNKLYRIINGKSVLMAAPAAFGTITDTLKAGKYKMVATGGPASLTLNLPFASTTDALLPTTLSDAKLSPVLYNYTDELFYYKGDLQVSGSLPIQTVAMNRIVGKLEINFEDVVPANARSITVEIAGEKQYYRINTDMPEGEYKRYNVFQFEEDGLPKTGYKLSLMILNTNSPFNVTITTFGGVPSVTKTIQNVTVLPNQRTVLSGKVFSEPASSSTITVNKDWGADRPVIKF